MEVRKGFETMVLHRHSTFEVLGLNGLDWTGLIGLFSAWGFYPILGSLVG